MSNLTVVVAGIPALSAALERSGRFAQVVSVESTSGLKRLLQSGTLSRGVEDKVFMFADTTPVDTPQTLPFLIGKLTAMGTPVVVVATSPAARDLVRQCPGAGLLEGPLKLNQVLGAISGTPKMPPLEPVADNVTIPLPGIDPVPAAASSPFDSPVPSAPQPETAAASPAAPAPQFPQFPPPAFGQAAPEPPFAAPQPADPAASVEAPARRRSLSEATGSAPTGEAPFFGQPQPEFPAAAPQPGFEQTQPPQPVFPPAAAPFGQPAQAPYEGGSPFGQPPAQPQSPAEPFGQPASDPAPTPFGQPATDPTPSPFGQPMAPFGQPASDPAASPFGQPAAPFGQPAAQGPFVQPAGPVSADPANPFGQPASAATSSPFGQPAGNGWSPAGGAAGPVARAGGQVPASRPARRGHVITVTAPKGGTGKSTLSLNLAAYLGLRLRGTGKNVCIVDANIQQADTGKYLNAYTPNVEGVLKDASAVHPDRINNYLLHKPELNLSALLGPATPEVANPIYFTGKRYSQILDVLRPNYDYIIIDTPVAELYHDMFRDFALPNADFIATTIAPNVATLMNTDSWLRTITAPRNANGMGIDRDKIGIVLNRAQSDIDLSEEDVRRELGEWRFLGSIPETKEWQRCNNRNELVATKNYHELNEAFSVVLAAATGEELLLSTPSALTPQRSSALTGLLGRFLGKRG